MITKTRIKILFVILISFLVVEKGTRHIFLANTPRINPQFLARIKNAPQELAQLPVNLIASIGNLNLFHKKDDLFSKDNTFSNVKSVTPSPVYKNDDIFANVKSVTPPPYVIFKSIAKGVSAAEDPQTGKKYIKIGAGTKYRIVGTVTINGKEYPKIEFVK